MRGPAISFERVGLTLGRTAVLEDVSLSVAPGTRHAVAGPNGGGKSSLLRALLGQAPHRGTIRLDWPGDAPGVVGYVPQAVAFDAGLPMTVDDLMAVLLQRRPAFLGLAKGRAAAVAEALDRLGMADKRRRRVGALSGGERQRVLLAQALLPAPDLLVLDEPMTALDEAGAALFEAMLADLRAGGTTVVWVEHDLDAVLRLADRVTGLNRRVLLDGAPAAVLTPDGLLDLFAGVPRRRGAAPTLRRAS